MMNSLVYAHKMSLWRSI